MRAVLSGQYDSTLRANAAVRKYVMQRHAASGQDSADEQTPMAMRGIGLAAHERDAVFGGPLEQALQARLKTGPFGHRAVERVAGYVVVLIPSGATAELSTEKHVAAAARGQPGSQRLAVEVRRDPRVRI